MHFLQLTVVMGQGAHKTKNNKLSFMYLKCLASYNSCSIEPELKVRNKIPCNGPKIIN